MPLGKAPKSKTILENQFETDNIGKCDYIYDLVDVEYPVGRHNFEFETIRDRSSCLCVAGESGAGKTPYVQNYVRDNVGLGNQKCEAVKRLCFKTGKQLPGKGGGEFQ